MKAFLEVGLVLAFSFSLPFACSKTIETKDAEVRSNGMTYLKGSTRPHKGKVIKYHDAAKKKIKSESRYKKGLLSGTSTAWFENGKPESVRNYRAGKLHGSDEEWYEDGTPKKQERYNDGKRDGEWQTWKPDGKLSQSGTCDNGEDLEVYEYYKDGSKHLLYRRPEIAP